MKIQENRASCYLSIKLSALLGDFFFMTFSLNIFWVCWVLTPAHHLQFLGESRTWGCQFLLKAGIFGPQKQENALESGIPFQCVLSSYTLMQSCMWHMDFPGDSDGKESACNAGDMGLIPGSRRSPGEGNGNSLQYSCLENLWTEEPDGLHIVHGVTKSRTWLK